MRLAATLLVSSVTLVACHRDPSASHVAPAERATADASPPSASPPDAPDASLSVPATLLGPITRGPRPLDIAIYTSAPFPAAAAKRAQAATHQRFPGVEVRGEPPPGATPPTVLVFTPSIDLVPPPPERSLHYFGRGLDDAQISAAATSKGVLVLSWSLDDDPHFARLRQAQRLAAEIATAQAGFIWDENTRELYTPGAWQKKRIDGWDGDAPDMRRHFVIHYYATDDGARHRAITLGMVKFGLPDLVVDDVPVSRSDAMTLILNTILQALVEGAVPTAGGELVFDVAAIRHAGVRTELSEAMAKTASRKGRVTLVPAQPQQGDADNRLLAVQFPSYAGATESERQGTAVMAIAGGSRDGLIGAKEDDPELRAATARAQARLPVIAAAFRLGLPIGESISVKAPFDTDDGSTEWMWIEVSEWPGEIVRGGLQNAPSLIKSLRLGAKVQVKQASIADYVWRDRDGKRKEGGESADILQAREARHP